MAYTLNAAKRTMKGEKIRAAGLIPGVVYGAGSQTESVSFVYNDFLKLYKEASESSLIDLTLDGASAGKVLLQETQFDPVSGCVAHVDLRRVNMNKPLTAMVELHFIGEAAAVKELGGTLVRNIKAVEVKCLPRDLVSYIEVDISALKTFSDIIKVKDLVIPAGLTVLNPSGDNVVAKAMPALTEEQIKALEEEAKTADVSKIELAGKKKEEEVEEGEAGEAAGAGGEAGRAEGKPATPAEAGKAEERKPKEKKN